MEKKSTIKTIQFERSYDGKYGKMYVYQVTMNDGSYGELQTTTENKYKINDEITYELKSRVYNNTTVWQLCVKTPPQQFSRGNGTNPQREQSIIRQSSLKCAVELCVGGHIKITQLFGVADKMVEWVNKA